MWGIYFAWIHALIHPYINYANIEWASTNKTYLNRILGKQKQAARLMPSDISIPLSLLMKELNILNVYQINILQHLLFLFKVKNSITPKIFKQVFSLIDPTRSNNYLQQDFLITVSKYVFQFKIDNLKLVLEVQQYGINFSREVKRFILSLMYLATSSKKKF